MGSIKYQGYISTLALPGTTAEYMCGQGYMPDGIPLIVCQANGTWSSSTNVLCKREYQYKLSNDIYIRYRSENITKA